MDIPHAKACGDYGKDCFHRCCNRGGQSVSYGLQTSHGIGTDIVNVLFALQSSLRARTALDEGSKQQQVEEGRGQQNGTPFLFGALGPTVVQEDTWTVPHGRYAGQKGIHSLGGS